MADAEVDESNKNHCIVRRYFEKTLHNNKILSICKKRKMSNAL